MSKYFTEASATEVVIGRNVDCDHPRLKEVMESVTRHLHAVVREVEPSLDEWSAAIRFLVETGQISNEKRQEFVLLSDILGVSMLMDAIANRKANGATESTVLGPFHVAGAPRMEMGDAIGAFGASDAFVVRGRVLDPEGNPIEGATLDVWQTDHTGHYDIQSADGPELDYRGIFTTGADGAYWFKSVRPLSYPIPDDGPVGKLLRSLGRHPYRPAHVHFIISAPGFEPVTTHLFTAGDEYLDTDTVFGVKKELIVSPEQVEDPSTHPELGMKVPFELASYDFVLCRA